MHIPAYAFPYSFVMKMITDAIYEASKSDINKMLKCDSSHCLHTMFFYASDIPLRCDICPRVLVNAFNKEFNYMNTC
jgi:hypothetical protein